MTRLSALRRQSQVYFALYAQKQIHSTIKLSLVSWKNEKIRKNPLTFSRNTSCVDIRKQKSGNLNVDETEIRSQSFPQAAWNKTFTTRDRNILHFTASVKQNN